MIYASWVCWGELFECHRNRTELKVAGVPEYNSRETCSVKEKSASRIFPMRHHLLGLRSHALQVGERAGPLYKYTVL